MKNIRMCVAALSLGAGLASPVRAIPIVFEFSGMATQHSVLDSSGVQTDFAEDIGTAWSAQFVVETDLFGPVQTFTSDLARQASYNGGAGAVTPNLMIGGASIDVARLNTNTGMLRVSDSFGFVTYPDGNWAIQPDQWGVNFKSREVTPQGTTGEIDFQMGFVDYVNFEDLTGGTGLLSLEDVTSPLSFGTLAFDNPLWFRDVEYSVSNYSCSVTCEFESYDFWSLGVTSVTRTVGTTSVPEPGSLALMLAGLGGMLAFRRRRG
jgi:hypothetical protein